MVTSVFPPTILEDYVKINFEGFLRLKMEVPKK